MKSAFSRQHCRMIPVILFLAMSLLSACTGHNQTLQVNPPPAFILKDGTLDFVLTDESIKASIAIEIADTPETQMKGLMGRSTIDDNSGMLFVFQHIEPRKFWMKNTPVPLDIIFIGGDGCIVNIAESTTPMSNRSYRSKGPVKYVVEVRAGFAKRFQIDTKTCIQWRRR
ncbi:MAG: DUF192 domain-containing protein [Deltaproteobacteria bacterium]|nr:DUF192 domain-containing protein [Deltaproteobacteria bacterium]